MNRSLDHVIGEAPPSLVLKQKFPQPPRTPRRPNKTQRKPPTLVSAISAPQQANIWKMAHVEEEEEDGEREKLGEEVVGEMEMEREGDDLQLHSTPARG